MIASAFWIVAIETAEDDSQLAYKPNELGLLCPGTTRQRLASCVQVSPWSQAFLEGFSQETPITNLVDGFSQGICVISPSIVSEGVLEYCHMLGTKPEYADFQFYIFKLLLYETA